jgi:hypothetical protein
MTEDLEFKKLDFDFAGQERDSGRERLALTSDERQQSLRQKVAELKQTIFAAVEAAVQDEDPCRLLNQAEIQVQDLEKDIAGKE